MTVLVHIVDQLSIPYCLSQVEGAPSVTETQPANHARVFPKNSRQCELCVSMVPAVVLKDPNMRIGWTPEAFGGEEPPNRYEVPGHDEMRKLWNEHVDDCSPGEVHNMGELIARDEEGVQAIYSWLHQSLAEMVASLPFNTTELLTVIRFMIGGIGYFIDGKCMTCGEVVCENMEEIHREQFIATGGTLRSEEHQCGDGEGTPAV